MNYLLNCPCGKEIIVTRSQAGQDVTCDCGNKLSVPTLRGLNQLRTADNLAESRPTATTLQTAESTWKGWRGILVSLMSALFVISIGYAGWNLYNWLQIDKDYTEEYVRSGEREIVDQMDLQKLNDTYYQFTKMGTGEKSPPLFYLVQQAARDCESAMLYGSCIAAVSLAATASLVLFGSPRKPPQNR